MRKLTSSLNDANKAPPSARNDARGVGMRSDAFIPHFGMLTGVCQVETPRIWSPGVAEHLHMVSVQIFGIVLVLWSSRNGQYILQPGIQVHQKGSRFAYLDRFRTNLIDRFDTFPTCAGYIPIVSGAR